MTKAALIALLLAALFAAPFLIASGASLSEIVTLIVAVFAFGCGALLQEVLSDTCRAMFSASTEGGRDE